MTIHSSPVAGTADHAAAIEDQFTRQSSDFAAAQELHNDAILSLMVEAGRPTPSDIMIDIACGPGSVVTAFAPYVRQAIGLDATPAMLAQAKILSEAKSLGNVVWQKGNVYDLPYPSATFNIVVCRFAFHHFEAPDAAFAEMVRVAAPQGRIVLCDAVASDDPAKAAAFNAMERWRDPSTVEFRTLDYFKDLFEDANLGIPTIRRFQVPYLAHDLVAQSFPANDDRTGLLRLIEESLENDALAMNAFKDGDGIHIAFQSVVMSAVKP